MSITVIIEANVKDFDKWLALFNELEDQRASDYCSGRHKRGENQYGDGL